MVCPGIPIPWEFCYFSFLIPRGKESRVPQFPKLSKLETQMRNSFPPIAPPRGSPRRKKAFFQWAVHICICNVTKLVKGLKNQLFTLLELNRMIG